MAQHSLVTLSNFKMVFNPTNSKNSTPYCKRYYQSQTIQTLGKSTDRISVPIWIATSISSRYDSRAKTKVKNVHESWIYHLEKAINDINVAAPGLQLYQVYSETDTHKICIYGIEKEEIAYTIKNIRSENGACIYLPDRFPHKNRTSVHEILHALGFGHEHQRSDASSCVDKFAGEKDPIYRAEYVQQADAIGITRFDPISVMHYCDDENLKRKHYGDPVWNLKQTNEINIEMSELDKVGLNIVYRPCKHHGYQPKISPVTGVYYCGRKVMSGHNYPGKNITGDYCGPDNGANCPACRVLKTDQMEQILKEDKWQGWSGLVYCGKLFSFQIDGYCGPDNGPPCCDCSNILYPTKRTHSKTEAPDCIIS